MLRSGRGVGLRQLLEQVVLVERHVARHLSQAWLPLDRALVRLVPLDVVVDLPV